VLWFCTLGTCSSLLRSLIYVPCLDCPEMIEPVEHTLRTQAAQKIAGLSFAVFHGRQGWQCPMSTPTAHRYINLWKCCAASLHVPSVHALCNHPVIEHAQFEWTVAMWCALWRPHIRQKFVHVCKLGGCCSCFSARMIFEIFPKRGLPFFLFSTAARWLHAKLHWHYEWQFLRRWKFLQA